MEKSYFFNNSAIRGGAFVIVNDTALVTESVFTYNSAIQGGAIYAKTGSSIIFNHSNFSHNSAKSDMEE